MKAAAALAALLVLAAGGTYVGAQVVGEPTVATQTFANVVTYTIPTETVTTTQTETVVSTVTEPATTTEPPPTTTEPPPPPEGTQITVSSGTWVCNQPLSNYGPAPLTVETNIPNVPQDSLNGDVRLLANCTGDGNPLTTDLVLHVNGNGGDLGSGGDGIVLVGAHDIELEGWVDCGQPQGGAHQDGVQMNRAFRLTFDGFTSGDWDAQTATCHGAGGGFYVSELNDQSVNLQDVVCAGCRFVNSTSGNFGTSLYLGASIRSGARDSCWSARIPLGQDSHAISPVNEGNLFIDRDSSQPQPSPSECAA